MKNVCGYEENQKIVIDNSLSFTLVPNGHLLGSCQVLLNFVERNIQKSLLITGDIGNKNVHNYYVNQFTPVPYADVVIGESTYGDRPDVKTGRKERNNDIEKLFSIVKHQVCDLRGRVIIPTFANHRLQMLATMLYIIFKDGNFPYNIYIDTPLGINLFDEYKKILDGDELKLLTDVMNWDKMHFIKDPIESKAITKSDEPCVVLSTSGMCQNGRIRHHLKAAVPNANATILFVGFSTNGSLASILKDKKIKSIMIDQKKYVCRCACYNLKSLSGHAPFHQLVDYYSSINTNKIVLHHGSQKSKLGLKLALENNLANKCSTAKVVCANSSVKFYL